MMPLQETRWLEMVYISVNDFLEKVSDIEALSRSEEVACAKRMKEGDMAARERLIQGYLPFLAGYIRHLPKHRQSLGLVLYCLQALEKAVDHFNFLQDSEPFSHRLNWYIRQAVTSYIVR